MLNKFGRILLRIPIAAGFILKYSSTRCAACTLEAHWINDKKYWHGLGFRYRHTRVRFGRTKDRKPRFEYVGIIGNPQIGYNECVKIARDMYLLIAKPSPQIHPDNVVIADEV